MATDAKPDTATTVKPTGPDTKSSPGLSGYVGKYPRDKIAGQRFLDNPLVKAALHASLPDEKRRAFIYGTHGIEVPIFEKDGRIVAWGAENRAEDTHNWAVAITPDGSKADVCIYETGDHLPDYEEPMSQWFTAGTPSTKMQGQCPSSQEDYPPKKIVAG